MDRFEFVVSRSTARQIELLAREYELTEQEVVAQLVELGIAELDEAEQDPEVSSKAGPRP